MRVAFFHRIIYAVKWKAVVSTESRVMRLVPPAFWRGSHSQPDRTWFCCPRELMGGVGTFGQFIMQITWLYIYTFESFGAVMFMLWFFDSQRGLPPLPPCPLKGGRGWGGGDNFFLEWVRVITWLYRYTFEALAAIFIYVVIFWFQRGGRSPPRDALKGGGGGFFFLEWGRVITWLYRYTFESLVAIFIYVVIFWFSVGGDPPP